MYKKVLSVILGAALMAGTLAGCGNSGKEAAATTAAARKQPKRRQQHRFLSMEPGRLLR